MLALFMSRNISLLPH